MCRQKIHHNGSNHLPVDKTKFLICNNSLYRFCLLVGPAARNVLILVIYKIIHLIFRSKAVGSNYQNLVVQLLMIDVGTNGINEPSSWMDI